MFSETQKIWILIPTADTDAYLSLRSTVLEGSTQEPLQMQSPLEWGNQGWERVTTQESEYFCRLPAWP